MRRISILGSTGSIGTQTLDVIREHKDICVVGLSCGGNIDLLEKQIREFSPKCVCVSMEENAKELKRRITDLDVKVLYGMEGLIEVATIPEIDMVVTAIVGMVGIRPTIAAIEAGKHIALANKETLVTAGHIIMPLAKEKNVVLAEAMTIYHMPLHKKLRKMVEEGGIGDVGMIQINFGSFKEYNMDNRFFNPRMAGGALLDIGVYAISLARYYLKSQPNQVVSIMKKAPSGVDEISGIVMQNAEGQMVVISLSLHTKQPKRCNICGENGYIEIVDYPRAEEAKIVYTESAKTEIVKEGEMSLALQYELEDMEKAILGNDEDILLDYTRDVMQIMTDLRKEWEMYYPEEIGKAAVSA